MENCDCKNGSCLGLVCGLALGGAVGFVAGAAISPSRREMKKMARKTAANIYDTMENIKESLYVYLT